MDQSHKTSPYENEWYSKIQFNHFGDYINAKAEEYIKRYKSHIVQNENGLVGHQVTRYNGNIQVKCERSRIICHCKFDKIEWTLNRGDVVKMIIHTTQQKENGVVCIGTIATNPTGWTIKAMSFCPNEKKENMLHSVEDKTVKDFKVHHKDNEIHLLLI